MKLFFPILILFSLMLSKPYEATVYLNNGTVIRGTIIDEKTGFYIQISSEGRNYVYQPFEIKKIVIETSKIIGTPSIDAPDLKTSKVATPKSQKPKVDISKDESEAVPAFDIVSQESPNEPSKDKISARKKMESSEKIDISNKINSIGLGVFTNKQFNFLQVTQDYKISDKWAVFAAFGFPNIFGIGIVGQLNYNDNGLISGASLGLDASGDSIISLTAAHQWRIGSSATFFSLGISRFMIKNDGSEGHTWSIAPIISIDARF